MYALFAAIFALIRTFCLPNPFDSLGETFTISVLGLNLPMNAFFFNTYIMSAILGLLTYPLVGLYYVKGSNPLKGCLLYMFFYCVHTGLLHIMSLFGFSVPSIILVIVGYLMLHVAFYFLKDRFHHVEV